jgi:urocanate hydratase
MMAKRIKRVLTTDPGMGIVRHVNPGYELAKGLHGEGGGAVPMKS